MKRTLLALFLGLTTNLFSQQPGLYVCDAGNFSNPPWQILIFDTLGMNPEVFTTDSLAWPQDVLFLPQSNQVLISNFNSGKINIHNALTGDYMGVFADGLGAPTRMKIGSDGYIYVLQWAGNHKVKRFDVNGNFIDDFTSIGVSKSIGLDWDTSGNLYVSSYDGKFIRKFSPTGADMGMFITSNLQGPTNIHFNTLGELIVLDYNGGSAKKFDANGNFQGVFIPGLNNAEGFIKTNLDHYLIGNGGTGSVKEYDINGNFIQDIVPANSGNLIRPNAVVRIDHSKVELEEMDSLTHAIYSDSGDNFYFSEALLSKGKIQIFDSSGSVIYTGQLKDNFIWNASESPNGIYLLNIELETGKIIKKKLIVNHQK